MTKLTQQTIDDMLPYIKPWAWDGFKESVARHVKEHGDVTQIIDTLSRDGKRIIKRNYMHADGDYRITLGAAHVGVRSIGDPTPLGDEYPECKAMQEKIKARRTEP